MFDVAHPEAGFIALVTIQISDPSAHAPLLDLLVTEVEQWVRHQPGFISANYHISAEGHRVVNYAQWRSEEDYRESFRRNPDAGALRGAILAVPGVETLEMVPYTLARSVAAATPAST